MKNLIIEKLEAAGINTKNSEYAIGLIARMEDAIQDVKEMGRDFFLKNTTMGRLTKGIVLELAQ